MTECYMIAIPRRDGGLPSPEKAWSDAIFWSLEDAMDFMRLCRKDSPLATIFKCHIETVEQMTEIPQ